MTDTSKPAPSEPFSPNEIILYGIGLGEVGGPIYQWEETPGPATDGLRNLPQHRGHRVEKVEAKIEATGIVDIDGQYNIHLKWSRGKKGEPKTDAEWTIAAIYGYAIEGFCYSFDRPKVMIFNSKDHRVYVPKPGSKKGVERVYVLAEDQEAGDGDEAGETKEAADQNAVQAAPFYERSGAWVERPGAKITDEPAKGCGFEIGGFGSAAYRMWRIRALDRVIEISIDGGFAQQLVLEANLPGRRSPNTYAANMQLAHRGGRLTGGQ